jgi:hypothetical protein
MKLTNKKAYMIPETEVLSLESQGAIMTNPASQFGHTDPDSGTGNFHAPKRTNVF